MTNAEPTRRTYWGDSHHNCYTSGGQFPPISEVLSFAATHLDFYTGAYYTPVMSRVAMRKDRDGAVPPPETGHPAEMAAWRTQPWGGIRVEGTKAPEVLAREWAEFQEAIVGAHAPGRFVAFPGVTQWPCDEPAILTVAGAAPESGRADPHRLPVSPGTNSMRGHHERSGLYRRSWPECGLDRRRCPYRFAT